MSGMTDQELANEYRRSMTLDVLHSWASEAAARLRGEAERGEQQAVAHVAVLSKIRDDFAGLLEDYPEPCASRDETARELKALEYALSALSAAPAAPACSCPKGHVPTFALTDKGCPEHGAAPAPVAGDAVRAEEIAQAVATELYGEPPEPGSNSLTRGMQLPRIRRAIEAALAQDRTPVAGDAVAALPRSWRKEAGIQQNHSYARGLDRCAEQLTTALAQDRASQAGAAPDAVDFWVCPDCDHYYMTDGVICDCHGRATQNRMRHIRMAPLAAAPTPPAEGEVRDVG